jgi:hypothetical protein
VCQNIADLLLQDSETECIANIEENFSLEPCLIPKTLKIPDPPGDSPPAYLFAVNAHNILKMQMTEEYNRLVSERNNMIDEDEVKMEGLGESSRLSHFSDEEEEDEFGNKKRERGTAEIVTIG